MSHNIADAIRTLAQQTYLADKPTERAFGVVTSVDPLVIQINEKLVLDEDFLVITQTVKNYINWKFLTIGDKVVMTRQLGGQQFIVDDMVACDKDFDKNVILKHTHKYEDDGGILTSTKTTEQAKRVE